MSGNDAPFVAVIPLKAGEARKTRLAERLAPAERALLAANMAGHVIAALKSCAGIARIEALSPTEIPGLCCGWLRDDGRGLNAELEAARATITAPLVVIHGDLPLLAVDEVSALLAAARWAGLAIAPDRHGEGTNAVAILPGQRFSFAFGPGSRALHRRQGAIEVARTGLAHDVDSPDDLDSLPAQVLAKLLGSAG